MRCGRPLTARARPAPSQGGAKFRGRCRTCNGPQKTGDGHGSTAPSSRPTTARTVPRTRTAARRLRRSGPSPRSAWHRHCIAWTRCTSPGQCGYCRGRAPGQPRRRVARWSRTSGRAPRPGHRNTPGDGAVRPWSRRWLLAGLNRSATHCLVQSEPVCLGLSLDQGLVHQAGQEPEHRRTVDARSGTDRFSPREGEARGEHGQTAQHEPLVLAKQAAAPFDASKERLVARAGEIPAVDEQAEAVRQTLGDPFDAHHPYSGRRQFQG